MDKNARVLDVESTGLSADKHRIIEISIRDLRSGNVLYASYVNPECPIPPKITEITGITDATVRHAPPWAAHVEKVREIIESSPAIIGQNPFFDQAMIDGEMRRLAQEVRESHEVPPIRWPTLICTKKTWNHYEPPPSRDLQNAFKRFVDPAGFEAAHCASADTEACRRVFLAQEAEFKLESTAWEDIDPDRKNWFGPTHHVMWRGAEDEPERRQLVLNFGKNRGVPVHEVELGFWKWIRQRQFGDHVLILAIRMIEDFSSYPLDEREAAITAWAHSWEERQAAKKVAVSQ